jgi:hypothetical protein
MGFIERFFEIRPIVSRLLESMDKYPKEFHTSRVVWWIRNVVIEVNGVHKSIMLDKDGLDGFIKFNWAERREVRKRLKAMWALDKGHTIIFPGDMDNPLIKRQVDIGVAIDRAIEVAEIRGKKDESMFRCQKIS